MTYRIASLAALLLVSTGCAAADFVDVRDDVNVWARHGYTPDEMLFVSVGREASTEAGCPPIDIDASLNDAAMRRVDDGGWRDPLLGESQCAATSFALSHAELSSLPAGPAELRIGDDSHAIELSLPTLLRAREPRRLEPASGEIAPGDQVVLAVDIAGDTIHYADAWLTRDDGSMSCPAVWNLDQLVHSEGTLRFVVPQDAHCSDSGGAQIIVKAEYDMAVQAVDGLAASRVSGTSYVTEHFPVAP